MWHAVAFISGFLLFALVTTAVVKEMVLNRPYHSVLLHVAVLIPIRTFRWFARKRRTWNRRDGILAAAGPITVLVELVVFLALYLLAFALMFLGISDRSALEAFFQSGATLLTLGMLSPSPAEEVLGFVSAFIGLVVVAILIGYLLSLNAAYTARESKLVRLSLVAGEPGWGPEFICRRHLLDQGENEDIVVDEWIDWLAEIRMTHTVNPVLVDYRSPNTKRHWLIGILALMDASNLYITTTSKHPPTSHIVKVLAEGSETVSLLRSSALYRRGEIDRDDPFTRSISMLPQKISDGKQAVALAIADDAMGHTGPVKRGMTRKQRRVHTRTTEDMGDPGITREEFNDACAMMHAAGVGLHSDRDRAWEEFAHLRAQYWPAFRDLCDWLYVVPAPWSGSRTPPIETIYPALVVDRLAESDLPTDAGQKEATSPPAP